MYTDPNKFLQDLKDQAAQHFEAQIQLSPFYVGHHDAEKNAVAVADRMGRPTIWINTDNIPVDIALSIGRLIANLMNEKYDGLLQEFDEQTGKVTAFRDQLQSGPAAIAHILQRLMKGQSGDGPTDKFGTDSSPEDPDQ